MQIVTSYGATTADSGGISVDPGGVANTKGEYSEITAATTSPIDWLVVAIGNANDTARITNQMLLDIAIGAAASEQIIVPDLDVVVASAGDNIFPLFSNMPMSMPTGVRIAARLQSTSTTVGDRLLDVAAYGVG
jgi:hypothetical protein